MDKICILLSAYNGEKYIAEQLISIINQDIKDCKIIIYIRNDGSNDATHDIINKFANDCKNVEIVYKQGINIGVQKSFIELMTNAPQADYYAFCDQDDYWKAEKLRCAIGELRKISINEAALFYSGYDVVDKDLKCFKTEIIHKEACHSITKIFFHNKVPGCVMVFNKKLLELCCSIKIDNVRMHDMYVLSIAYLFGNIIKSEDALIQYRQHDSNVIGYKKRFDFKNKGIRNKETYSLSILAELILNKYSEKIDKKNRRQLELIKSYKNSLRAWLWLLLSRETCSQNRLRSTLSIKKKIFFKTI